MPCRGYHFPTRHDIHNEITFVVIMCYYAVFLIPTLFIPSGHFVDLKLINILRILEGL